MTINDRRSQIDDLDRQLLELLNRRARLAIEIGRLKAGLGLQALDPVRERAILSRACEANPGPLDGRAIERIFSQILSESRRAAARALGGDAPPRGDAAAEPGMIAAPAGAGLSGGVPASAATRLPVQTPPPRKEADHAT